MKNFGELGSRDKRQRSQQNGDRRATRRLQTETLEDRRLLAADVLSGLEDEAVALFASVEPAFASGSPSDLSYALGDSGQLTTVDTQYDLAKPNHSPVFFHDDSWWGVFRSESDGDWWLWERDSGANWSQTSLRMGESGSDQPDVIVDADANRMYTFFSHASSPDVFSATYNGSSWSLDSLVNGVEVPGMAGPTDQSVIALASRWATPTLFAFRYGDTEIVSNWSTDHGRTWQSSTTTIADGSQGMSQSRGLVDATEFSWNDGSGSANYVAVAYGENSQGQFGLITIREGDSLSNENSWDHTVLPDLAGGAQSDDHISITRDGSETDNRLYIVGKTEGGGSDAKGHALFVRSNDPTGSIGVTNVDAGQSRPVAVFDSTNDELYVITTNASGGSVAYRKTSTPVIDFGPEEVFIENGSDDFINGGTSHTPVNSTSGLLYVSGNKSDDDIWENHFSLGPVIPVPGVVANPISELVTSEDGGTAVFGVVLKAEPTAPVSVPISSSDESEGTVDKTLLTFTPANWNVSQFVTITGIEDSEEDGAVAYEIEIGPASGAAEYLGIDATNPSVVNLDNDQTAPIASLYFAVDDEGTIGQGLEVGPEDIILDNGASFSTFFDGSDVGLEGFALGSFDILSPSEILLTFESSENIPGVGDVETGDVVKFTATQLGETTAGFFELYFRGADVGVDDHEIDAMSVLSDGRLMLSFTGSFSLSGASGKDEDMVAFTPTSLGATTAGTWEFLFDGGDVGLSDGGAEDVDAVAVGPDGEFYFSTPGDFNVPGASGGESDIVVFEPLALGTATSGDFLPLLAFEGEARGLNGMDIKGIDVPSVPPVPNEPPEASEDLATTDEDQSITIAVLSGDSDPNDDSLNVTELDTTLTVGSATINPDNTVDYSPPANFHGADSFDYTISDGRGGFASATVTVSVNSVNDAPSFTLPSSPDQSIFVDAGPQALAGFMTNLSAGPSDESGQLLQIQISTDNDGLFSTLPSIDPNTGDLSYTIGAGLAGSAEVTVQVMDDGGTASGGVDSSAPQVFTITVTEAPLPPTAVDDLVETDEDQSQTIAVLTGDSDPNDDPLTVTQLDTTLTVGSATINPDNTVDYTPAPNFHGVDSFEYTISDGQGGFASATVTVTVHSVNDAPSFSLPANPNQSIFVDAGPQSLAGFMTNLSAGPADESGQLLQIQISTDNDGLFSTLPSIDPNTGDLSYTIGAGLAGSAEVTVQVMDDGGTALGGVDSSAPQVFTITVTETPLPPTAVDDLVETDEDQPLTIAVLNGDSDPNDDPLTVTQLDTTLTVGAATINLDNTVDYTPAADFHGVDSFEYTISDGQGGFASATVTVTVHSVNDAPVVETAISDVSVFEDSVDTLLDLSATFSDVDIATDADSLTISVFDNTNPTLVTANLVGEELTLSYTPGQTGVATLTIRATDLSGAMVDATFEVSVNPLAGATDVIYFAVDDEGMVGAFEVDENDIIAFDGVEFRMLFDGSDVGISGLKIDALDVISPTEILLSFAKGGSLPIVGQVDDEDVILFTATELGDNTSGVFSMYFDGTDVGLNRTDVDAVSLLDDGRLLLSASDSYSLSGAGGKDEDLFAFTPTTLGDVTAGSFEVYFDGSDVGLANGGAEDTDAASVSASGVIYLSTPGNHSVTGAAGGDNEILLFTPTSVGASTSGVYDTQHYFSGAAAGLGAFDIKAFDVPDSAPALAQAFAPPSEFVPARSSDDGAMAQSLVRAAASLRSSAQRIQPSSSGESQQVERSQFVEQVFAADLRLDSPRSNTGRMGPSVSEREVRLLAESRGEAIEATAGEFDAFFEELEDIPEDGAV